MAYPKPLILCMILLLFFPFYLGVLKLLWTPTFALFVLRKSSSKFGQFGRLVN